MKITMKKHIPQCLKTTPAAFTDILQICSAAMTLRLAPQLLTTRNVDLHKKSLKTPTFLSGGVIWLTTRYRTR